MRVSLLRGTGDLVVEERPDPVPGPYDVLVEVASVGVCGSDIHYYEHGRIGSYVVESPLVLGHEASGVVVGLGSSVTRLSLGQRVSVEPGVPDFTCRQCLAGRYNLCERNDLLRDTAGRRGVRGAGHRARAVRAPGPRHPQRRRGRPARAAVGRALGLPQGRGGPGARVLVTGAGPVGLVAAQAALALGAASVAVTDVNPHRLALALDLGVTEAVDVSETPLSASGREADVLLECSGHPGATADAILAVAPAGRVVLVGMGGDEATLPVSRIQEREITLTGTFRYAHTWPGAIALAASGRVQLDRLVTGHYGLDRVAEALTVGRTDPHTVKPMVVPSA